MSFFIPFEKLGPLVSLTPGVPSCLPGSAHNMAVMDVNDVAAPPGKELVVVRIDGQEQIVVLAEACWHHLFTVAIKAGDGLEENSLCPNQCPGRWV